MTFCDTCSLKCIASDCVCLCHKYEKVKVKCPACKKITLDYLEIIDNIVYHFEIKCNVDLDSEKRLSVERRIKSTVIRRRAVRMPLEEPKPEEAAAPPSEEPPAAAAVVERVDDKRPGRILSNVVLSQVNEHAAFGGVVPEIAARHALSNRGAGGDRRYSLSAVFHLKEESEAHGGSRRLQRRKSSKHGGDRNGHRLGAPGSKTSLQID